MTKAIDPEIQRLVEPGLHLIPPHMHQGVRDYMYHGYEPGSFLSKVLCNDFMGACCCADGENLASLPNWAKFLYNYSPSRSHGSPQAFEAWMKKQREREDA